MLTSNTAPATLANTFRPGSDEIPELELTRAEEQEVEEFIARADQTSARNLHFAPVVSSAYSYEALVPEVAGKARAAVERIRKSIDASQTSMLEIGREFLIMKEALPQGEFGKWIAAEFDMTDRTAQNFMNAATLASKYETVSVLPATALYKLAAPSTPGEVRERVVAEIASGNIPTAKEIVGQIAEAKDRKTQEKAQAAKDAEQATKSPEELKRIEQREKNREKREKAEQDKRDRESEERRQAAGEAVALVKKLLGADFDAFRGLYAKAGLVQFESALKQAA